MDLSYSLDQGSVTFRRPRNRRHLGVVRPTYQYVLSSNFLLEKVGMRNPPLQPRTMHLCSPINALRVGYGWMCSGHSPCDSVVDVPYYNR
eukprot:7391519-Prymnesium_polylepis.3